MNTQSIIVLLILSLILFSACEKENTISEEEIMSVEPKSYSDADKRLWPFFQSFEEEAALRGVSIDLEDLNVLGHIGDIDVDGVAGRCKYGSHIHNEITIDAPFWENANQLSREFVVFHELGHCVLLRAHTESAHSDGTCTSLMRSGALDCKDNYNTRTRSNYIDELFSQMNTL